MKRIAVMTLLVFRLPSCAKGYRPLVDPATIVDRDRYERDLSECAAIADQNVKSHQAATGAAGGALWGAGLGAPCYRGSLVAPPAQEPLPGPSWGAEVEGGRGRGLARGVMRRV